MTTDTGHPPVVRLLSDTAVLPLGGCPAHRRVRADLSLGPARHRPREVPAAVLHAVLDLVEHRGWSLERACAHPPPPGRPPVTVLGERVPPVHEGVRRWVRHAARTHLAATAGRTPVPDFRVRQYMPERGARHRRPYEVRATGRCYTLGAVRELWVPVPGRLRRAPADAGLAVAAYVLATGAPVDREAYAAAPERFHGGAPYPMRRRDDPPERVRVIRVSCLDGATEVRFDGTAADSEALFVARGREGLRSALVGGARAPGADCLACAVRSGCGRLPRAPGLLGLGPGGERRSWSPATTREHALCPARAHFRALGLPSAPTGLRPPAPPPAPGGAGPAPRAAAASGMPGATGPSGSPAHRPGAREAGPVPEGAVPALRGIAVPHSEPAPRGVPAPHSETTPRSEDAPRGTPVPYGAPAPHDEDIQRGTPAPHEKVAPRGIPAPCGVPGQRDEAVPRNVSALRAEDLPHGVPAPHGEDVAPAVPGRAGGGEPGERVPSRAAGAERPGAGGGSGGGPPPGGPGDGVVAGAVRAWLERAHERLPRRACEPADLPVDPARWACAGRRLFGARARRAAALLAAHIPVCPLRDLPAGDHVRSGPTLTADDTEADVLVVYRTDVLHHRRGSWVHRSVLISEEGPPGATGPALFAQDPRAALGVLFFASGVIAAGPEPAVEVEVLGPDGARVDTMDPASPQVLAAAERTVRALVAPWHRDRVYAPVPGPACRTCPYRGWCPQGEGASP
ncbi:PD-(D/E)XK nuclease family protein [Nocardiopsis sp. NPDC057823]|uniref:PD-(D/E)XK nuclease family protein n=1 Tax=Nocardiopsis sp. NPDC057823 TaxID=3346256 RepID=UPI00366CDB4B